MKYSGAIWSAVILLWIAICLACVSSIISTSKSLSRQARCDNDSTRIVSYPYFEDIDEQLKNNTFQRGDSGMIEELWKNQKYLYSQNDNLLADVRQETNNAIEKLTAELNFWIAILAFLGVLVPIAITHKGEREARNWLEKQESLMEKKESIYEDKIRTAIIGNSLKIKEWSDQKSKMMTDLSEWKEETEEKLNSKEKEQEKLINALKIQRDVEMLTSIRNNRFIENDNDLKKAYNETARNLIESFLIYLNNQLQDYLKEKTKSNKQDLIRMSILLFDVINNVKLSHTDPSRPRILYQAEDAIKSFIKILLEGIPPASTLEKDFSEIMKYIGLVLNRL